MIATPEPYLIGPLMSAVLCICLETVPTAAFSKLIAGMLLSISTQYGPLLNYLIIRHVNLCNMSVKSRSVISTK